jgi:ATP-dependent DNA ligase
MHDRRRGQRAKFIEEIYRDWIIPDIMSEILKGKTFLATLTSEELRWVADQLSTKQVNERIKELAFQGIEMTAEEQEAFKSTIKEAINKKGSKQLLEILRDEARGIELKIGINIAGKQKDLVNLSDKVLSIFQFAFADPQRFQQAMQNPSLAKSFEDILEYGGLSLSDFSTLQDKIPTPVQTSPQQTPELAIPTPTQDE